VTYGANEVRASLARLNELGIKHTGAGINRKAARTPAIVERDNTRFGFLQYTSVFWPSGQAAGERTTGVATIKANTAYQPKVANRAGVPPIILTSADDHELAEFKSDIASLRQQAHLVVSSHHWGQAEEVLQYQQQIAHTAIDAGADIVMGHGGSLSAGDRGLQRETDLLWFGMFLLPYRTPRQSVWQLGRIYRAGNS
jgi:poly-gamma-glutamate synthesis protein (capsule biosynthesis protein)